MSLTVVVPTSNRPAYLETCLRSISRQTAVDRITQVIVSENGGSTASEDVCRRFDNLNIIFRMLEPRLPVAKHFHRLLTEPDTEFVALLCDDDWWYPWHLETAFKQLDARNDLSAFCSQSVFYDNKLTLVDGQMPRIPLFLLCPNPDPTGVIHLSTKELVPLCWLYTPFHCSTLVARAQALKAFSSVIAAAHPYYLDRILYPFLSLSGRVAYHISETVGIRNHQANDVKTYPSNEVRKALREGSDLIENLGFSHNVNTIDEWRRALAGADIQDRQLIHNTLFRFLSDAEVARCDIGLQELTRNIRKPNYFSRLFMHWWKAFKDMPKPGFYQPLKSALAKRTSKIVLK